MRGAKCVSYLRDLSGLSKLSSRPDVAPIRYNYNLYCVINIFNMSCIIQLEIWEVVNLVNIKHTVIWEVVNLVNIKHTVIWEVVNLVNMKHTVKGMIWELVNLVNIKHPVKGMWWYTPICLLLACLLGCGLCPSWRASCVRLCLTYRQDIFLGVWPPNFFQCRFFTCECRL